MLRYVSTVSQESQIWIAIHRFEATSCASPKSNAKKLQLTDGFNCSFSKKAINHKFRSLYALPLLKKELCVSQLKLRNIFYTFNVKMKKVYF